MIKYDIQLTLSGTLSYDEVISISLARRANVLGLTDAYLTCPIYAGYRSPVTIGEGEDAKTFFVMFDTGSSDFWIFSNLMGADILQVLNNTRVLYDPLDSTTTIGDIAIKKNRTVGVAVTADVNEILIYD